MTPRGVEHADASRELRMGDGVKIPMTPRGVEHRLVIAVTRAKYAGEDSYDAERR